MYSDLFDQLGGRVGRGGAGAASSTRAPPAPPPLVSLKAGKMTLDKISAGVVDDQEPCRYKCTPDTKRGEIRLVYQDSTLSWQWYDRRDQKVIDTFLLPVSAGPAGSFERVELPAGKKHSKDRIYVWSRTPSGAEGPLHDMYWMQDASEEKEDELVAQINQYLADPASAKPNVTSEQQHGTGSAGAAASRSSSSSLGGDAGASSSAAVAPSPNHVDALSSILENLGMPQSGSSSGRSSSAGGSDAAAGGTLTLADLQGAMVGMQQQAAATQPVPLTEVVTPAAITSLLEQSDEVKARLVALLPEEQRTEQYLEENLRSPQVQATLRQLTQALLPDDAGNMDGFYSVLANFGLNDPARSSETMAAAMTNPIQAFLDAIVASVEKEKKEKEGTSSKDQSTTEESRDADGDEKMDEGKTEE